MNKLSTLILLPLLFTLAACDREETTYMVGTLERDRIDVVVESNEPIISIQARDGQEVQAGDLILEQDPERAAARLAQQVGLRDQAAARLAELERGPREESIREARAKLEASRAREVNALAIYKRTQEVFDQRSVQRFPAGYGRNQLQNSRSPGESRLRSAGPLAARHDH